MLPEEIIETLWEHLQHGEHALRKKGLPLPPMFELRQILRENLMSLQRFRGTCKHARSLVDPVMLKVSICYIIL